MLVSTGVVSGNVIEVSDPRSLTSFTPRDGVTPLYFKQELCPGYAKIEPAILRYVRGNANVRLVIAPIPGGWKSIAGYGHPKCWHTALWATMDLLGPTPSTT